MYWSSMEEAQVNGGKGLSMVEELHRRGKGRSAGHGSRPLSGLKSQHGTTYNYRPVISIPHPAPTVVSIKPSVDTALTSSPTSHPARCRVASSAFDKGGLGLHATVNIKSGRRIMSESPFLILDHPPRQAQIRRRIDRLSLKNQNLFHSFSSTSPDASDHALIRVVVANVIPLGKVHIEGDSSLTSEGRGSTGLELDRDGMFKHLCRTNHSCVPNARWDWDAEAGEMHLKALLPIRINDEITVSYLEDKTQPFAERQAVFKHTWDFTCQCQQCTLRPSQQAASDQRLARYRKIRDQFIGHGNKAAWQTYGFNTCWDQVEAAIAILNLEERYSEIADGLETLFHLAAAWGELGKAIHAGNRWRRHLHRLGEDFALDEIAILKRPEELDSWAEFVEEDYDADVSTAESSSSLNIVVHLSRLERWGGGFRVDMEYLKTCIKEEKALYKLVDSQRKPNFVPMILPTKRRGPWSVPTDRVEKCNRYLRAPLADWI